MKIYVSMLCLLFVGMSTNQCMEQRPPKQLRHLDWKKDILELEKNRTVFSDKEYQDTLDQILEYAVDRQEKKKGKLSADDREKTKLRLLQRARSI